MLFNIETYAHSCDEMDVAFEANVEIAPNTFSDTLSFHPDEYAQDNDSSRCAFSAIC